MARWQITVSGKGIRKASVEKLAAKLKEEFGEGASVSTVDATPPESRAERFSKALDLINNAKCEMESLKEEMENWHESLPENLRNGSKADEIQQAIDDLDSLISELENCEGTDVAFPGMY